MLIPKVEFLNAAKASVPHSQVSSITLIGSRLKRSFASAVAGLYNQVSRQTPRKSFAGMSASAELQEQGK
jgi:hypothetical protein